MVYELFVKQLDGCTYCSGGLNCTAASEAMWLFRASQGKITTSSCHVRALTGDTSGGTHLGQMEDVSLHYGISNGKVYRPIGWDVLVSLIATKRYGTHLNISYQRLAGSAYDCFGGRFRGNHDVYVSGPAKTGFWRVGDPGADGRRAGIPSGFQDIPIALLKAAAGDLDLGGHPLGSGKAYAYITPPDPVVLSPKYAARVIHPTSLWNPGTKRWVYSGPNAIPIGTTLTCRSATYTFKGVPCYPIDPSSPHYPGYYIPKANVKLGARIG